MGEPNSKIKGGFPKRHTEATRHIKPDDMIGSLKVIAAAGHSPDEIALFETRDGTLLAGDAFQTQAGTSVAGTFKWLFPFLALATWHKATALETAKRLRDLNPTCLAVGHGPVLKNPLAAMDEAIRQAG